MGKRNFTSKAVEDAIVQFKAKVKDKELAWLFENCFPNTLDTTVFYALKEARPDTYVIIGDIDAMWEFLYQYEKIKNLANTNF